MRFQDTSSSTKVIENIQNKIRTMLDHQNLSDRKTISEILDRRFLDDNFETPLKKGYSIVVETTKTPMPESNFCALKKKTFTSTSNRPTQTPTSERSPNRLCCITLPSQWLGFAGRKIARKASWRIPMKNMRALRTVWAGTAKG